MSKLKAFITIGMLVMLAGAGALTLLNSSYTEQVTGEAEARLAKAEVLATNTLRVGAFQRIAALWGERNAQVLRDTVTSLARAGSAEAVDQAIQATAAPVTHSLNEIREKLSESHLALIGPNGEVVRQAPKSLLAKNVKGLPLVRDCLAGLVRDGLYELDGQLCHLAAVPVPGDGAFGCLQSIQVIDAEVAARIADLTGLAVAIYLRGSPVASTMSAASAKELGGLLEQKNPIRFGSPSRSLPFLVSLREANLARVAAIPSGTEGIHLAVALDLSGRFASLAAAQRSLLWGLVALLAIGVGLVVFFSGQGAEDQLQRLRDSAKLMAENNAYVIEPDSFAGVYQEIALALRHLTDSNRQVFRPPETISQILRKNDEPQATPAPDPSSLDFESLLGPGARTTAPITVPRGVTAPPPAITTPPPITTPLLGTTSPSRGAPEPKLPVPAPAQVAPKPGGRGPRLDIPGDLASFFDESQPKAPAVPPMPASAGVSPANSDEWDDRRTELVSGVHLSADPFAMPSAPDSGTNSDGIGGNEFNDQSFRLEQRVDATVIAQVPEELLKVASFETGNSNRQLSLGVPPPSPIPALPVDAEEEHFREVFREFVETKKQCGEPADGLTADKFIEKLRKNAADLKSRFRCKSVRFQVHTKNGKAALKATPIK